MIAVILAAGMGSRMNVGKNKVYMPICGKAMLLHTVEAFEQSELVDDIIVVTGKDETDSCRELLVSCKKVRQILPGGDTRQQSSYIGVSAADSEYVLVHDGARALITPKDIDAVAEATVKFGAAAVGSPCVDTMKKCSGDKIISTVDRENLYKIFTPQGFLRSKLLEAHKLAIQNDIVVTDDCALYEHLGETVRIVVGNPLNIKITTPEDIIMAEAIIDKIK